MKLFSFLTPNRSLALLPVIVGLTLMPPVGARVLDDFNDNTKTGWTDFSFAPPVGVPTEQNGVFRFEIPKAFQEQAKGVFSASTKSSETFTLAEGRTIEFRVDVLEGGAKDSFAVLSWIPVNPQGPSRLQGYSLAKSTTDVLIVKGINKYFVADDGPTAELKQENTTLVLAMTVKSGNVIVNARVLDKDDSNAVIWERTIVDTPEADVMEDGVDDPKAPFLGEGNFVLYLYADYDEGAIEDPYVVVYDNAEVYVTETMMLDDFNDNTKTAWTDFSFAPPYGIPVEENGVFRFEIPKAFQDQAKGVFSASTKTSRTFDLLEGERVEFSVDVVQGGAKDSFAVLSWIPVNPQGPSRLQGYSLAKSTTDLLIVKGINKYFVADDGPTAELKQENITLVLAMTVKGGSVIVNARVLDKDDNHAVIWDRTIVDTSEADVMEDGVDDPKAPFLGAGNFVLYLYADYDENAVEDPYVAVYDNAIVSAPPPPANTAPILSDAAPAQNANFLPATTAVSFKATDDGTLADTAFSISLNGTNYTSANGLAVTGAAEAKTATLSGKLVANVLYKAILRVEDSEGLVATTTLYFDTFAATSRVIEVEDYNFVDYLTGLSGGYVNDPVPGGEGGFDPNGYSFQYGTPEVDFYDTRPTPNVADTPYRPSDPIRMQRTRDFVRPQYDPPNSVFDYDVGDIAANEWMNYTRDFAEGSYEVYLREAVANLARGESVLELVTGDRTLPGQTTQVLGSFLGELTGFQYRCFPLTDGSGQNKIVLNLSGTQTLRLRQVTADGSGAVRYLNYLVLVPAAAAEKQRALVASVSPAPDSTVETVTPAIRVVLQNRETSVKTDTITLTVNGVGVAPTITPTATGAEVDYAMVPLPAADAVNQAQVSFQDTEGVTIASSWSFAVSYRSLDAANRQPGPGKDRGFQVRMVQADPANGALANSLERAEQQLAPNSPIPAVIDTRGVQQLVEMSQDGGTAGFFAQEYLVPGLEEGLYGTDDFSVEATAWLELSAGPYRMTVISDDGFKVSSGASLSDKTPILGFRNGGPADEQTGAFDFIVPATGFYPFRMIWYERGGSAHAEWTAVNLTTGVRTLINDAAASGAIKAYLDIVPAPAVKVQSSTTVTGGFADDATAVIDTTVKRITVPMSGGMRFYRLVGASALTITKIELQGANLVMIYQ